MLLSEAGALSSGAAFLFGVSLTSFKTALADAWTQRVIERKLMKDVDLRRVGIFHCDHHFETLSESKTLKAKL